MEASDELGIVGCPCRSQFKKEYQMRSSILIKGLMLVSILVAPSCLSGVEEDEVALGSMVDSELLAADQPGDGRDQIDEARELTTLAVFDKTYYWIRNCYDYPIERQVIALYDDELYAGEYHSIAVGLTVSGSVRGRVLRLRRR
jgi:hypothetical protein